MSKLDRIVNLKEEMAFVEPYVLLRNRYCDVLLTTPVNVEETKVWLKRDDIEIIGIACGNVLIGVAILFLNRKGEIAFFSEIQRSGLGSRLLSIIEAVASNKGLCEVWAWVLADNIIAQQAFLKNGYLKENESMKEFQKQMMKGFKFKKELVRDHCQ